ncbi:MAG TPA: glycosyltransferase family 39 protein [Bacteroidia bacterium]|nr:glycosyltransferase family 39 protein [Bacteroidia bacterium]
MINSAVIPAKVQVSKVSERILLFAILLFSALFRIISAYDLSLSNDELSALTRARYSSFSEMIINGVLIDFHPAGVQSFIYYWIKIFGDNPFLYRIPFVLAGIACTYLIFRIGKLWFSSFTGLIASSIFAVFQFSILYSFFARPYSPGLYFALLATLSWTYLFFPGLNTGSKRSENFWWLIFTLAMIGCIHTHYFSLVFAATLGLTGLLLIRKNLLWKYLISGALIIISFYPELDVFKVQISTGDIGGWLAPPGKWYLKDFIFHVFNDSALISMVLISLSVSGLIILIINKEWNRLHAIAICLFLFSFLTAYLYSIWRHPVIQYSTLYFTVPFLLFLLAQGIERIVSRLPRVYLLIPVILISGSLHTLIAKDLFSKAQYGVFSDIAEDLKNWQSEFGKDSVPAVINVVNPEYLNYYFRKINFQPKVYQWQIDNSQKIHQFREKFVTCNSPYFCFVWTNASHPYELIRIIKERYPVLLKKKVYFNSASYLFSKEGESLDPAPDIAIKYDFNSNAWLDLEQFPVGQEKIMLIDSLIDYGPGFRMKISELNEEYHILTAKIDFRSSDADINARLVISFDSAGVPVHYSDLDLDVCNLKPGEWQPAYLTRVVPKKSDPALDINVYIYNRERKSFEINNFEITIEEWDDPYKQGKY